MLIKYSIAALCLFTINLFAEDPFSVHSEPDTVQINKIRNEFYLAVENDDVLDELVRYIEDFYQKDSENYPAVILAYYGALETLRAKHSYNPYKKTKYVIAGLKKLNAAVNKSPSTLEVRFLRFAVLHNIPGIFGIIDERNDDLKVTYQQLLKKDYKNINIKLQKGIVEFLIKSGRLDSEQVNKLINIYPDLAYN